MNTQASCWRNQGELLAFVVVHIIEPLELELRMVTYAMPHFCGTSLLVINRTSVLMRMCDGSAACDVLSEVISSLIACGMFALQVVCVPMTSW